MERFRNTTKTLIHNGLKIIGILFLLLGILGLFLPAVPGVILLILGVLILGEESIVSGWIINRLPKKQKEKVKNFFAKRKENNDKENN